MAAIEVQLRDDRGWCILQGTVDEVMQDGSLTVTASMTTPDGPRVMDRVWSAALRDDPAALETGAWIVVALRRARSAHARGAPRAARSR